MDYRSRWYTHGFVLLLMLVGAWLQPVAAVAVDDSSPPRLLSFSLTPRQVDSSASDQLVTLTMRVSDDLSGVKALRSSSLNNVGASSDRGWNGLTTSLFLVAPTGTQYICFSNFTLVSGDEHDGVYTCTKVLPQGSTKGPWTVDFLVLVDELDNRASWSATELEAVFGAGSAAINNNAAVDDSTPPQATGLRFSPGQINTSTQDQVVTVTITAKDDLAGISSGADTGPNNMDQSQLWLIAPSGGQSQCFMLERVSGDDRNGVYTGSALFPRGSTQGQWRIGYLTLVDKLGNRSHLGADELELQFGTGAATISNAALSDDSTPPKITSLSITPEQVNTSSGSQRLTVTLRLTDDLSGVCAFGDVGPSVSQIQLVPLIGTQQLGQMLTRVSGNERDGVYTAQITMPRYSKEGIWTVGNLLITDQLGNGTWLNADELSRMLTDSSGITFANTAEASSVTIDREWSIATTRTAVTFPAGTVVSRGDGGSFAFYRMTSQESLINTLPLDGLAGSPVGMLRIGIPGLDLSFSKPVKITMNVGTQYEGHRLQIQSLREDGARWANETQVLVTGGKCTFTTNHATHYAGSIVRFKPTVSTPRAPKTFYRSKPKTVYGYLKPRHKSGTYPIRIYRWRKTASGSWKKYGYVKAKVSNYSSYSRYSKSLSFPRAGTWRIRAYHPSDSGHFGRWSANYDYVKVK